MAKRYKKKEKGKMKYVIVLIILMILCGIIYWIISKEERKTINTTTENRIRSLEEQSNVLIERVEVLTENKKELTSDLLIPKELQKEVIAKIGDQVQPQYVVKIQYELKKLDEGKITLCYKKDEKQVLQVQVDIKTKKIENMAYYENESLAQKSEITGNLEENVKEDFEKNKESLNLEEKSQLNIMMTDTEVVININGK